MCARPRRRATAPPRVACYATRALTIAAFLTELRLNRTGSSARLWAERLPRAAVLRVEVFRRRADGGVALAFALDGEELRMAGSESAFHDLVAVPIAPPLPPAAVAAADGRDEGSEGGDDDKCVPGWDLPSPAGAPDDAPLGYGAADCVQLCDAGEACRSECKDPCKPNWSGGEDRDIWAPLPPPPPPPPPPPTTTTTTTARRAKRTTRT